MFAHTALHALICFSTPSPNPEFLTLTPEFLTLTPESTVEI